MTAVLSFDDFVAYVENAARLTMPRPARDLVIGLDFEITSMQVLDMIVALEEAGAELSPDAIFSLESVGELYDAYCAALETQAPGPGELAKS